MKICIVSDSHDNRDYLQATVGEAPATWVLGDLETMEFTIHDVIPAERGTAATA